jgi:hypothetical protein
MLIVIDENVNCSFDINHVGLLGHDTIFSGRPLPTF